mgnify:CR=1 FL=1
MRRISRSWAKKYSITGITTAPDVLTPWPPPRTNDVATIRGCLSGAAAVNQESGAPLGADGSCEDPVLAPALTGSAVRMHRLR